MKKSISYIGNNILGPKIDSSVRDDLKNRGIKYGGFGSSRSLLVGLCKSLLTNSIPDQVIINTTLWNLYDEYIMKIATLVGAKLSVVSLNPTPLDINEYEYEVIPIDKIKSFKGYTFVVCKNNVTVKYILDTYGSKYLSAGTYINKQRKINQIVVYGSFEYVNYEEGKASTVSLVPRPDQHYSFYSTLGKLYIVEEENPSEQFLVDMTPIQDITLILAKYLPIQYTPDKTQYEFDAIDTLTRLNILHYGNPTYLAFNLSEDIYSTLFLNLWKWDLFPGIVISSFLKFKWSNGKYEQYETSLERNLALWHDLVSQLRGDIFTDAITTVVDSKDHYDIKKIIKDIKRTSDKYGIVLYGQFTVSGAIKRALPLLELIYSDFRVGNVGLLTNYTIPLPDPSYEENINIDPPPPLPIIIQSKMVPTLIE